MAVRLLTCANYLKELEFYMKTCMGGHYMGHWLPEGTSHGVGFLA